MNLQTLAFIIPIALLLGNFIGLFLLWYSSREAVRNYPELRIRVPENAEDSSEWQAWARENGYKRKNSGVWAKGRGIFTSATEIRFEGEGGDMLVQECVNLLFLINRFAINAPILAGKPVRMMKIRALNKLMAQWHLPEIVFDSPESKIRIKK